MFLSLIFISILILLSFLFSNKILNMIVDDIAVGASIPSDINFRVRQFTLSFKDGIILKDVMVSRGDESVSIPRVAVKREAGFMILKIDKASLDWSLIKGLAVLSRGDRDSESVPLKINLKDVSFSYQGKDIDIKRGFILSDKNGLHWDLGLNCCGLNFSLRGYSSFKDSVCLFNFESKLLKTALIGKYDFNRDDFIGGFLFKDSYSNLKAKILRDNGVLSLSGISLGPLSIPGPIELNSKEELRFDWVVKNEAFDASGLCNFRNEEDRLNLYIKVLKSKFGEYELITNSYMEYILNERALVFKSVGTVLNNMPFPEISFKLALSDNSIVLERFDYEGGVSLSGYFDYNMNYSIQGDFNNFDLHHIMTIVMPLYARYLSVSRLDGNFSYFLYDDIKFIDIALELQKGRIIGVIFDSGKVHLIGNSSMLEFLNSELIIDGMPLAFEGNIDMSKFPSADMWADVILISTTTTYPFGKSFFEDRFGDKKMSLGARLKDNVRLDYNVEFSADENYNKNEVSLEIIGSPYLKLRLKDDEEIMGVEKNIKF